MKASAFGRAVLLNRTMDISKLLLKSSMPLTEPTLKSVDPIATRDDAKTAEQIKSVAQQFETVLLHQVIKQMKETVDYTSLDEEDESGEQINSMYWSFMADAVGQEGGLGLWKSIYQDLATSHGVDVRRFPADGPALDERL